MNIKNACIAVFLLSFFFFNSIIAQNSPRVIVFSKTMKYRHKSIEAGIQSIKEIGAKNNFSVLATEDSGVLISNLNHCDAVIFLSPSGDILNESQQKEFRSFIENGGGFIGIHSASAAEYNWPWYGEMLGAVFLDHPKLQDATIDVVSHNHPATSFLNDHWTRYDEWYNFKSMNPDNKVLLILDESSYTGGKHGKEHPIAWFREYSNRKVFYTALGHTTESFYDKTYVRHLTGGILYVLDKSK